ncbi:MAG: sterol desaturase family protein [Chroococcidiopsidaceae cyanobacterium CP_BM_ER_R8_30]|nr:sterol desaturase family protein [Chroococcidiopsidaceae cyanobacterium CP_BM_ER_R8_30]
MTQYLPTLALDFFRLGIWLVLLMVIFVPLERLCAQRQQQVFRQEFFVDLGYYFLNNFLPKLLLILPISIIAWGVHHLGTSGPYTWVAHMPLRVRFVLAILVGEFGAYWGHRWSHEIPWLWRFHAIHHSAKEMDWLVNTRAHPLDMFFTRLCGLLPIYVLGLAQPTGKTVDLVPLLYALVGTVWSFFVHANVRWRFAWLEKLVATPAFHHWHHTNDGTKYINKNYAAIFPWMDKLFGTLYLPRKRWTKKYGIDMPIAPTFTGQLLQPFRNG